MKILVVNLLRLGDFLQSVPVLAGLKSKHPHAQVDVLVHTPVAALRPLVPAVNRWWTLDRDELQAGLGRSDVPLLTSFDVLKEQCEALSQEKYDLILNLSHTEFSGWITGFIVAKSKVGLAFNSRGQASFNSPWFRYLNRHAGQTATEIFHYSDIFAYAAEAADEPRAWPMKPTAEGEAEVAALNLPYGEWIAIQALTSDAKKNWGGERWARLINELSAQRPQAHFVLLGAPNEKASLNAIIEKTGAGRVTPAVVSLDGALALLKRAALLITGDTSIKHLANAATCKVVELSLGSSDYRRTGIYKAGSLIVQGQAACAPCPHSNPCSQASHLCAENVHPETVATAIGHFMEDRWDAVHALKPGAFLRTHVLATGYWYASEEGDPSRTLEQLIERSAQKFILNGSERGLLPKFGSEVYLLGDEISGLIEREKIRPLLAHLDFLGEGLSRREIEAARERRSFAPAKAAPGMVDLAGLRSVQNRLEDERREIEVKTKLIRSLKSRLAEWT